MLESLNEVIPQSGNEAAHLVDKCKESVSSLKKCRQPFEAFYKRQSQLIQELQTVPGFEISSLKRELSQVQQKFGYLGEGLTKKLNNLDSQLVIWKQVEQTHDEFLNWISDIKQGMLDALDNLSDSELAKLKLTKYRNELPQYDSIKGGIETKAKQLKELNKEKEIEALGQLSARIDKELEATDKVSNDLENALGNLSQSSRNIKEEIKV